mgnify:CR=1 FL=1
MKILVLAADVPATSRMPGSPRLFNLCQELSRHHEMMLMALSSSSLRLERFSNDPATKEVFKRVHILPSPSRASWLGQQWHRLRLGAYFETRFRHRDYHNVISAEILNMAVAEEVDLVYVDLIVMAQYIDSRMLKPVIVDMHDSWTLLLRRTLVSDQRILSRLRTLLSLISARRLEKAIVGSCDLVITNSSVDERVVRELSGSLKTITISNGVDTRFFTPINGDVNSNMLVFTGVMSYHPNEDAAIYFAEVILPLIKVSRPQVEFWIVGSQPSERVRALEKISGVHVTGEVEDVRPFLQKASVFVCPLRVGSGVKNKILAALAMEKAIVASTISVDGLDLANRRDLLLADDPASFAESVLRLLDDPREARHLAANGLARVQRQYSWAAMGRTLEGCIQSVLSNRSGCANVCGKIFHAQGAFGEGGKRV